MKPISLIKEMGDTESLLCPGAPQGSAWFHHHKGFALVMIFKMLN